MAHICVWWELLVRSVGRNSSLAIPLWHAVRGPPVTGGLWFRRLRDHKRAHLCQNEHPLSRKREPASLNRYVESRKQHPEQLALYISSEYSEAETAKISNQFVEA